jgi:Tfp pilus assembly protein FimT
MEVLVVMSLLAVFASIGLLLGFDSYQRTLFHSDESQLITALQHARSQAISNVCLGDNCSDGKSHGVYIDLANHHYVMFQGSGYTAADHEIEADVTFDINPHTTATGLTEVVFMQLSGEVATPGSIVLTDQGGRVTTVAIGAQGQIF